MTDLFAQEGINYQSSSLASTHPSATPDAITAPHVDMPPESDAMQAPGSPAPSAPTSNHSGQIDPNKAVLDVFEADIDRPAGQPSAQPAAGSIPQSLSSNEAVKTDNAPRDLFEENDIHVPTVAEVNTNAFNNGAVLQRADAPAQTNPKTAFNNPTTVSARFAKPAQTIDLPDSNGTVQKYAAADDEQIMQIARTRYTPDQITAMQGDKIGFIEAFNKLHANQVLPGGGISQFSNSMDLVHIAEKVKAGEPLTPDDQGKLNSFIDEQVEQKVRGFSWGGNVAYIGSQIPAFVAEFALSDGFGKMAQTAAKAAVEETAAHAALSTAAGVASRVATTTALMPAQYELRYGERRLNDISSVTDKGEMVLKDSTESPAKSAMLAFAHTSADVAAQVAAPGIGKYIVDPATKAVSTPLIAAVNQLPAATKDGLYQAYKLIQPNATVSKVFTAAGWAGMVEQLGANRIAEVLHATLDLGTDPNMTTDKYLDAITPSKDQLLVEAGLVGMAGGLHTAASVGFNLMKSKGMSADHANETINNMSALEKENYVNDNLPTPKSNFPAFPNNSDGLPEVNLPVISKEAAKSYPWVENRTDAKGNVVHYDMAAGSPEASIVNGQIAGEQQASPPPVDEKQSNFNAVFNGVKDRWNQAYASAVNDLQPIENLAKAAEAKGAQIPAGEQPKLLANQARYTKSWILDNIMRQTSVPDADGTVRVTGKGLKQITDDFDNMFLTTEPDREVRLKDFNDFLESDRFIEEAANADKTGAMITQEQSKRAGDIMDSLSEKYGDNFRFFGTFADEIRQWDNRILHNLVSSGLWSQDRYDETVAARSKYSPLQRVVEQEEQASRDSKSTLGGSVTPSQIGSLKQFKGSKLEVRNTFEGRMLNAGQILQRSASNRLRVSLAKYSEYYPDDVKVQNPAIIQQEVKQGYDPKLRDKLEAVVEHFGGSIERTNEKAPGEPRGTHGSYSEMHDLIRLRLGSSEGTLTHEVGHLLDSKLGLGEKLLPDPKIKAELQKLAEDRIGSKISLAQTEEGIHFQEEMKNQSKKYKEYIKIDPEVIANMYDAYVNAPEQMAATAPRALKAFNKILDSDPKLAFLKEVKPSTARATETIQRALRDMQGPKDSVPVYIDGKRKYLVMSKPIEKAMRGLGPIDHDFIQRFLLKASRGQKQLLQFGATHYPAFMARHYIRSWTTSFLNIPQKPTPKNIFEHFVINLPKATFDVINKTDAYYDWKTASGGFNSYMDMSDKGLKDLYKKVFNDESNPTKFFNPVNWFHVIRDVSDQAARVAVFKKSKELGMSDLEAGYASLEATGNYGRKGSMMSGAFLQGAPFLNDMIQAGDRFSRSLAKDPAGYAMRGLALITAPQILLTGYYLFGADEKTRDEYLNFPDWSKSTFMHIKFGDTWVPIPRAFAPGFIFGALPEKIMIHMMAKDAPELKNFWLRQMAETITSVSPVFDWSKALPPFIKSSLENITNFSFFRQRPLFSKDLEKTLPADQYNQYTSETAKVLGKMFNLSPAKIDNTVEDMTAQIGKYGLQLSDAGMRAARHAEGQPVSEPVKRASDNPLYGKFIAETPAGSNTEAYAEFQEHLNDSTQEHNHLKQVEGTKEGSDYQKENARDLAAYPSINAANRQISEIMKQIRTTNSNVNMTSDQKKQIDERLNNQITKISESANMRFRQATGQQ